jgi:hypothetical protein
MRVYLSARSPKGAKAIERHGNHWQVRKVSDSGIQVHVPGRPETCRWVDTFEDRDFIVHWDVEPTA